VELVRPVGRGQRLSGETVTWTDVAGVAILAAQLLVLLIAAAVARGQVREARRLRLEQNRPFVVVDFDVEGWNTNVYLEVSNIGTSLARDVRIEIEPPLESAIDVEIGELKMLREGIATMAPGKRSRSFVDMGFRRAETELAMNHIATVTYRDEDGGRSFREVMNLDLDQYMSIRFVQKKDLHDLNKQMESIRKVIERWGSSGPVDGLVAMTPTESRAESERVAREMEARRRPREDAGGS
jgi:hypothetical protein